MFVRKSTSLVNRRNHWWSKRDPECKRWVWVG